MLLPAGGMWKIASEEQLIKLITGETDEQIKTPPSAAPVRYRQPLKILKTSNLTIENQQTG